MKGSLLLRWEERIPLFLWMALEKLCGQSIPLLKWQFSNQLVYSIVYMSLTLDDDIKDGNKIHLSAKEMGSSEIYPQTLVHSPNGRFVTATGDGEYIIYTALRLNN